jgi:hypothetical protein
MKRKVFITMLLLLCVLQSAMPIERITLKNGNVYEGYTYKSYVNGKIFFKAEKSIVNINDISKIDVTVNSRSLDELNDKWREWAESNPLYVVVSNGKRSLNLSNINGATNLYDVFILEQGEKSLKYLTYSDEIVIFESSSISAIETTPRSYYSLSGINAEVQIRDSLAFTGEIICKTANAIKLLTLDKSVKVLPYEKITKISKHRVNENLSIAKQVSKLDFVVLKNATSVTGVITLETFNKDKELEYLLVETKNGEHIHIKKSEIDYLEKIDNKEYVDIKDVDIEPGKMMICNTLCDTIQVSELNDYFVINDTVAPFVIDYAKYKDGINVIMKNSDLTDDFKLVKVERKPVEIISNKKRTTQEMLAFTYKDIVESRIKESESLVSVNGNLHRTYKLQVGSYVIFNTENKKCYYIVLE